MTTLYATGGNPQIYYYLIGDDSSFAALPTGTSICFGLVVLLIITFSIATIVTKFYQKNQGEHIHMRFPDKLNYLSKMVVSIGGFVMVCGVLMNLLHDGNIWIFHMLLGIKLGILTPLYIIIRTTQVKTYVQKIIKQSTSNTFIIIRQKYSRVSNIDLLKVPSQIHPIE